VLQFDPLDEYPIHQLPMSMRYVGTSDRNFYDRCIFQGVDHDADAYFITGLGVYPTLGVIDAYATVRRGDRQWAVRASGARPDDKMKQQVGPYRIEVIEPFKKLRLICDADEHGLGFDLLWESDYGPIAETASCSTRRALRVSVRGPGSFDSTVARWRSRPGGSPQRVTDPGESGRWGRPSPRGSRSRSTACGGAGSRCASTTSPST
jgi:hypothetical protein